MNTYQPIYDIAEICARKNLKHVVLCPGSRCAPLTLAFTRHQKIEARTFTDERSAGFIAMGIAQQTRQPSILVCTSGTAGYNFAPAVAEAFFSQTPLLIFTADRPAEWIAQHDGQTIHQMEIFGKHVKKSLQLPQEYEHTDSQWAINRIVNEAINLSLQEPRGPVHINAPFREPLYPEKNDITVYNESIRIIDVQQNNYTLPVDQQESIAREWRGYHHVLIVSGQQEHDEDLSRSLKNFLVHHPVPITGDIITNLHPIEKLVRHADVFLGQAPVGVKKSLQPDLLITFGKSVISKNLKLFLRQHVPKAHWHIQPAGMVSDPFQTLTRTIHSTPVSFFDFISTIKSSGDFERQQQDNYNKLWEIEERKALRALEEFFPQNDLVELELVKLVINNLPPKCNLHLANSMSVRYGNFIGLYAHQNNIEVFSNRGTSGIDGCTSTTVGHCLSKNDMVNVLITGDLAFFYDRNAFWHNYPLPNLRILLLNNHGSVIFKMIDGPAAVPEADEYFSTRQKLNAKKLCEEFDFDHLRLDNRRKLKNLLKDFFELDGKTKILELETDTAININLLDSFKQKIKESYAL
jgi:2-succinyl-5-enolpyruvyl-6-hydroxy-3-cyclohexene-1-carboxylate synthase